MACRSFSPPPVASRTRSKKSGAKSGTAVAGDDLREVIVISEDEFNQVSRKGKNVAIADYVGGETQLDEDDHYDDDDEEEEEDHDGRSKKEGHDRERKAADEDPIDAERYVNAKNPYFVTRIRTRRSTNLYVPLPVVKDYKLKLPRDVEFQDPNGRTWSGRVKVWEDGRSWICGWGALCHHNNVKKNDRCICEFLEKGQDTNCVIKVHIIRGDST